MTDTTRPLKRLRLARGFTQEELANEAGVSRSTIQKIESGGEPRYPNMYRKVADALGVSIEQIRGEVQAERDEMVETVRSVLRSIHGREPTEDEVTRALVQAARDKQREHDQ